MTRIGIDVGGVIIRSAEKDSPLKTFIKAAEAGEIDSASMFADNFLEVHPVEGAFESIAKLVEDFGAENIFIISKCGKVIQSKTLKWMLHTEFFEKTGMQPHHVHFCITREEKAPIANGLKLTHFIDDRIDVLSYMAEIVENRILFMCHEKYTGKEIADAVNAGIFSVDDWDDALAIIEGSVAKSG